VIAKDLEKSFLDPAETRRESLVTLISQALSALPRIDDENDPFLGEADPQNGQPGLLARRSQPFQGFW
jgi:hypothetical protein